MSKILDDRLVQFNHLNGVFSRMRDQLQEMFEDGEPLGDVERATLDMCLAAGKAALEDFIQAQGDGNAGKTLAHDGVKLKRSKCKHTRVYRSVFGKVDISRYVYAKREGQKQAAVPLDQKLGLPELETSYLLQEWTSKLAVQISYSEVEAFFQGTFKVGSSTTTENCVRSLCEYTESFLEEVSPADWSESHENKLRGGDDILVVLADGKSIPVRTSWDETLVKELGRTPRKTKPPNYEFSTHKKPPWSQPPAQRITVGACYQTTRVRRTAEQVLKNQKLDLTDGPESAGTSKSRNSTNKHLYGEMNVIRDGQEQRGAVKVFQQLQADVAARDPQGKHKLVCIMDGDKSLWRLQQEYFPQATPILDIFHVMEKLWDIAQVAHPVASKKAENWVHHYLQMILMGNVDSARGILQRTLNKGKCNKRQSEKIQHAINYFRDNRQSMRYDEYLSKGYPIGSGVIEGACKHVIGSRFCGSGMRWETEGALPLLRLRTIYLSGAWDAFMKHRIQKEQRKLYETEAVAA